MEYVRKKHFDKSSTTESSYNDEITPVQVTVKGLANVKSIKPSYCVLYSDKVGDVLVLVSDWLRYKDDSHVTSSADRKVDFRKELMLNELMYFEGYFYPGHTRDGYRAERVEKTLQGRAVVSCLYETYGFMYSVMHKDIFFAGAVMVDEFCGLKNLMRTLRINDEIRFVAIKERKGRGGFTSYKAIAAVLPSMGKEDDDNCVGVVVDVTASYAKLYCRPLGPVFLTFSHSTEADNVRIGQRLKFTCRRFNGRYEAFGGIYELLPNDFVFKFPRLSTPLVVASTAPSTSALPISATPALTTTYAAIAATTASSPSSISPKMMTSPHEDDNEDDAERYTEIATNAKRATRRRVSEQLESAGRNSAEQKAVGATAVICKQQQDENFCWSDLEKELEEITCDFTSKSPPPAETTEYDISNERPLSSSINCSPTTVSGAACLASNSSYAPAAPAFTFDNKSYFSSPFFTVNNNNPRFVNYNDRHGFDKTDDDGNANKDAWSMFSSENNAAKTELSQTQTSSARNRSNSVDVSPVATLSVDVSSAKSTNHAMPAKMLSDGNGAAFVNVECQTDFVEEKSHLLNELMDDCEIFQFVAQRKPNLVYKYSMQKR